MAIKQTKFSMNAQVLPTYLAQTCKNLKSYDGWLVNLTLTQKTRKIYRSLRLIC